VLASGTGSDLGRMTSVDADITTDGLRYTVTSATQSNLCGREVEAYGPASLAAATITGDVVTSVASSVAKGNAANLVNGQLSPDWGAWQPASLGSTTPEYVYYLFPEERPIHSVRVIGEQGNMPSVLYLQYLMAGGNPANNNDWITWDSKTGLPNDWRTVWLHHGATGFFESTGVRILIEGNQNTSGYNWFRLFEIEIYDGSLAIPEPASVIMLGAAGLLMLRRRVRS